MLKQDEIILAFNNKDKGFALSLAIEGSLSGTIYDDDSGNVVQEIKRDKGEGEHILPDIIAFARTLEKDGILENSALPTDKHQLDQLKCGPILRKILAALDAKGITVNNPRKYYQAVWTLLNRYIGKRAPVSRLIRMRTLLGKKTELICSPEVLAGTKYERLLQNKTAINQ